MQKKRQRTHLHRFAACGGGMRYHCCTEQRLGNCVTRTSLTRNDVDWLEVFCPVFFCQPELEQNTRDGQLYYGAFLFMFSSRLHRVKKECDAKKVKQHMLAS